MAKSYGNISLRGAARDDLIAWLGARRVAAWVGPEAGLWVGFTEATSDAFDLARACESVVALTADLAASAIIAAVHQGDVLGLMAVDKGRHVASYISWPGLFAQKPEPADDKPMLTGAAGMLAALGSDLGEAELKRVLGVTSPEQFFYPLAVHGKFIRTFGLPPYGLEFGFAAAEEGTLPGPASDFSRLSF
jgi:hypothetical protein